MNSENIWNVLGSNYIQTETKTRDTCEYIAILSCRTEHAPAPAPAQPIVEDAEREHLFYMNEWTSEGMLNDTVQLTETY